MVVEKKKQKGIKDKAKKKSKTEKEKSTENSRSLKERQNKKIFRQILQIKKKRKKMVDNYKG